jgi:YVTN family beta-propeller protein
MKTAIKYVLLATITSVILISTIISCKHQPQSFGKESGYPEQIARIFETKCVSCHNSANNLGGLNLETWDMLFWGGGHGASIIPYDINNSILLYFINIDSTLGPTLQPTMPFDPNSANTKNYLSRTEYLTIRNWIASGAPDRNGNIPFASNADTRQKFYIAEQGCDILSVIDAERKVIMRNIPVGTEAGIESSHCVRTSKDGQYAYVLFYSGLIQKVDTRTDKIVDQYKINKSGSQWNVLLPSENDSMLLVSDLSGGEVKLLTTSPLNEVESFPTPQSHGLAANAAFDTFYAAAQTGNFVYRITRKGAIDKLYLSAGRIIYTSSLDLHELQLTPDGKKLFATCQASNEVRVLSTETGKVIDSISVGALPLETAISNTQPYIFISCQEDQTVSSNKQKGAIAIINYNTNKVVKTLYGDMYQPHGMAVDDDNQLLMVVSRNRDLNGPAPHHTSSCAGKNGFYTFYDMSNNFGPVPASGTRKYEAMVDPYSCDIRFKKQ